MPHDTETVDRFRARARAWLAEIDIPDVDEDLDARFKALRQWQKTLYDAGWLGIGWSTDPGGPGRGALHRLVFAEELARAGAPSPIGLIGLEVVGPSIDRYGTDEQRTALLPPLLSGDDIWCQGFSEPEAGSDLASLRTRAVADGDDLVVSGQKIWTSWAHEAQWCALLVRTDPTVRKQAGISYLLVDMSSPGITTRPIEQMTGDREFCEVFLDEVRVPRGNLLGAENQGWAIASHTLGHERASAAVRRRVECEVALGDAVTEICTHLTAGPDLHPEQERRLTVALGRCHTALRALDAQTRETTSRLAAGTGPTPVDSVDKLLLTEVEQLVFAELADLLGPLRAVTDSRPLGLRTERWAREHLYSRAASIYGGSSQIQRTIVAERLLGLPRG